MPVAAALAVAVVAAACSSSTTGHRAPATLRRVATRPDIAVGAAVNVDALRDDAEYRRVLARQYDMVTPENVMKWDTIHPAPQRYDFTRGDELVAFARRHHMQVRGHNLVWSEQNPDWLTHGTWTRDQLLTVLHDHIRTVVGHYRGKVAQWDVVNEALDFKGDLTDSIWLRVIGPEYLDLAFRWAHEADPHAKLFYNEDTIDLVAGLKDQPIVRLVTRLRHRGVPIDGLGIEMHTTLTPPTRASIASLMRRLRAIGVDVAITEMDVRLPDDHPARDLDRQAHVYSQILAACLAAPNCHTFATWGFTDRYSWIPSFFHGYGTALPFDAQYRAKPAASALIRALARPLR